MIKSADELKDFVTRIFAAAGGDESNSRILAEHLVDANLSGVDTHGVWHVAGYVKEIQAGHIVPTAHPEILKETPSTALVSGNWTFGQVAAKYAMEVAIDKAANQNVALVGLVKANHIGRLGEYVEMAATENMISMVWAGGFAEEEPFSVPYGGRERLLSTNPVAMAFPAGQEPRMMFDFATTASSGVKIIRAHREKQEVPLGWIVDKEGNFTTNTDDFFDGGGAAPAGGHKGYAFMLAVEWLGRIFTGADSHSEAGRGGPVMGHQGVTLVVFRADLFQPLDEYGGRADELRRRVQAVAPASGFEEVLVPGDPEYRTRSGRQRDGIPIPDYLWQELVDVANSLGVETEQ